MAKRVAALLAIIAVLLGSSAAFAAESPIVIRDVSLVQYPRVELQLTLPSALLSSARSQPVFSVRENGRAVEVLDTKTSAVEPVDVVLVVDSSGSMKGDSMSAAQQAAMAFTAKLKPGSRVAVVSFADKPRVVAQLTDQPAALEKAVFGLKADGETALYDALSLAANEAVRAEVRRPIVVLLSDGGDTVSRVELDSALKDLRAAAAPVLVVALPSAEADFGTLRSIAKRTGGRFATVGKAGDLTGYYERLAQELQTSWTVTYVSRRPSTNDLDIAVRAKVGEGTTLGSTVVPNPLFAGTLAPASKALQAVPPANVLTLASATALVFVAVFALVAAVALLLIRPRTALDQMKYYDQLRSSGEAPAADERGDSVTASVLGAVDYVAGKRGIKRLAYEQLERAGLPLRPTEYITIHLFSVIAAGIVVEALSRNMLLTVVVVILTTALPIVYLDNRVSRRRQAFNEQLPDVLNLIAGSLRSGWGLQQSLSLVVEQMAPPVATEFARAETEIRLGRDVESALEGVARRMESTDFAWAVTAIGIQREVGGNLAEVLDIVAATIRDKGALQRQISGLTAEGRLSAWILIVLPFVLVILLSIVNPEYLSRLYNTSQGVMLLIVGSVLLVIGALWLRRIVEIEV